jgi:CheY-like chemotaxis protein
VGYKILLIENDERNVQRIQSALAFSGIGSFDLERVEQLQDGIQRLNQKDIAVILLSLRLPDSDGIEPVRQLLEHPRPGARRRCQ